MSSKEPSLAIGALQNALGLGHESSCPDRFLYSQDGAAGLASNSSGGAIDELLGSNHRDRRPSRKIFNVPGDDRLRTVAIRLTSQGRITKGHPARHVAADVIDLRGEPGIDRPVTRTKRIQYLNRINDREVA